MQSKPVIVTICLNYLILCLIVFEDQLLILNKAAKRSDLISSSRVQTLSCLISAGSSCDESRNDQLSLYGCCTYLHV